MFSVAVSKDFVAQHFLFGGDWGPENQKHSHHYRVEVQLHGNTLDRHGYLADIREIEDNLNRLVDYFRDRTLNELPEFNGLNPSIETFARIFHRGLTCGNRPNISSLQVKIWEDSQAWAAYHEER